MEELELDYVSVDEVMNRTGLPRPLVVYVFKAIAASGVVTFKKGANGRESRIEF